MAATMGNVAPTPQQMPNSEQGEQQEEQASLQELIGHMQGWFRAVERSAAAFNHLNCAYLTHIGEPVPGGRKKGLPIFKFNASASGADSVECVIDMKHVDPQHVPHVLAPMINSQRIAIIDALQELEKTVKETLGLLALPPG